MKHWMQFGLAAVFAAVSLHATSADALYRRTPGANCVPAFGSPVSYGPVQVVASSANVDLGCPLPEDDRLPKQNVTMVHVHGHNAGGTVFAQVCEQHWFDNTGVNCTSFFSSAVAEYGIFIDGANLSPVFNAGNAADTAGVFVVLPSTNSTVRQIFQGN